MSKPIKESVRLREKQLNNGNISLYLDIYLKNGKRKYEFLKLYIVPDKGNKEIKEKNKQTLMLANAIKSKRLVEEKNGEFGFNSEFAEETLFFDYYKAMCEKRLGNESKGNWGNWRSCLKHLEKYEKNQKITF